MTIYTKKGDAGMTSTVTGEKVSKASQLLELQGTIDEINAHIGVLTNICCENMVGKEIKQVVEQLRNIQYALFRMGTDVSSSFTKSYIKESEISELEKHIDFMQDKTGLLKNFIYYSGTKSATYTHVIRTVTRRAERIFARLLTEHVPHDYKYINRLSDYFFALARYLNHLEEAEEAIMVLKDPS